MSRVEELQRMCDNINENGGLDSGEWHTALLAQIAQNLAVIADVMMADCDTEPTTEDSSMVEPQISPSDCKTCKHNPWSTPRTCDKCIRQEDGRPSMYESEDEPQITNDFKITYTCSFTDCDNFKNFGFGEKCIECKRKQSEAKYKDEPQYHADIECNYKDCDSCGHKEYCPQREDELQTERSTQ